MTLSELNVAKILLGHRKNILGAMVMLERNYLYQYQQSNLSLNVFDSLRRDMQRTKDQIDIDTLAIVTAEKEWEIVESYLEIYEIAATDIYRHLAGKPLEDFIPNNNLRLVKEEQQKFQYYYDESSRYESAANAIDHEEDEKNFGMPGFGPSKSGGHRAEALKYREEAKKKDALIRRAKGEWEKVRQTVTDKNLTADEYLVEVKKLIAILRN